MGRRKASPGWRSCGEEVAQTAKEADDERPLFDMNSLAVLRSPVGRATEEADDEGQLFDVYSVTDSQAAREADDGTEIFDVDSFAALLS